MKAVETVKQEKWSRFRDRRGDWGRDAALYLGRKHGGLKLKKLGELADVDYGSVSMAPATIGRATGTRRAACTAFTLNRIRFV